MSKKASGVKSLGLFFLGVLAFFAFRWGLFEPYVIPSGSMIPSLLINDHILVNKHAYGLRWPFTDLWIFGPKLPKRGEIVVFRSKDDPDFFMVKRVVGLPGDQIQIDEEGLLQINLEKTPVTEVSYGELADFFQQPLTEVDIGKGPQDLEFFVESLGSVSHVIQLEREAVNYSESFEVPDGEIFLMGDNRHHSQDSRYWGTLPIKNLLGRAERVWLSCRQAVRSQQVLCHPGHIRWQRLFYAIQ